MHFSFLNAFIFVMALYLGVAEGIGKNHPALSLVFFVTAGFFLGKIFS